MECVWQIFRILENANAQDFPPNELSQILYTVEVKEKLLKVFVLFFPYSFPFSL